MNFQFNNKAAENVRKNSLLYERTLGSLLETNPEIYTELKKIRRTIVEWDYAVELLKLDDDKLEMVCKHIRGLSKKISQQRLLADYEKKKYPLTDAWNAWAQKMVNIRKTMSNEGFWTEGQKTGGHHLSMLYLACSYADFSEASFKNDIDLSGIIFPGDVSFEKSSFHGAVNFSKAQFRDGFTSFKEVNFAEGNYVNFSEARFKGSLISFEGTLFQTKKVVFDKATFQNKIVDFSDCIFDTLETISFQQAKFHDADFLFLNSTIRNGKADFTHITFNESIANFSGSNFSDAVSFADTSFERDAYFNEAIFSNDASFFSTKFSVKLEVTNTRFDSPANFSEATFHGVDVRNQDFQSAVLSGADFQKANLQGANMIGATFDEKTNFAEAKVTKFSVNRYSLECLKNYGGLTVGARMTMDVHDDVLTLRSSYSGYQTLLHIVALFSFLFPYIWFVFTQWGKARFLWESEQTLSMGEALARFIFNGGANWEKGWFFSISFVLFLFALSYNALRLALLAKTKKLELTQEASGIPVAFSLNQYFVKYFKIKWQHLLLASKAGLYVYLLVVLFNSYHFFTMRIPI